MTHSKDTSNQRGNWLAELSTKEVKINSVECEFKLFGVEEAVGGQRNADAIAWGTGGTQCTRNTNLAAFPERDGL